MIGNGAVNNTDSEPISYSININGPTFVKFRESSIKIYQKYETHATRKEPYLVTIFLAEIL